MLGLFIGFGASSMGNLATSKLVTNWFDKRRGMALGIAAAGVVVHDHAVHQRRADRELRLASGVPNLQRLYLLVVVPLIFAW